MTIDEAITKYKEITNTDANCPVHCNISCDKCVQESEQLAEWLEELKTIKEMDLDIPQHFTKEQSNWIKAYCIKRNIEFYNKAIDDFVKAIVDRGLSANDDKYCITHYDNYLKVIKELAEQLKAGGENEQSI